MLGFKIWHMYSLSTTYIVLFSFIAESMLSTSISIMVLQKRKYALFSLWFLLLCQYAAITLLVVDSSWPVCWKCFCNLVLLCKWTTALGNSNVEKFSCISFSRQDDLLLSTHITCNGCHFSEMVSIKLRISY